MPNVIAIGIIILLLFITTCCVLLAVIVIQISYNEENTVQLDQFCTIETKSGRIRGKQNHTLFEKIPYFSFRGVPYAKPPIGNLRFKAPQKIDPWNGILDALEFGDDCMQSNPLKVLSRVSEDCLNLNVYVPSGCSSINPSSKLPVMVFIYGGGFAYGSSTYYGPDFFMETNVIIVTFNSRLGPFGFLSLNLPEYSGNMGLKDQVLALRWIHENIEQFGGDKNNITLFGHSSGAIAVGLQMLSPQTNDLFSTAIMLNGAGLLPEVPGNQDHYSILRHLVKNAINPFLTKSPIDILTNPKYKSDIDTLYLISPHEVVLTDEQKNPNLLKHFDKMFQIQLPLAMARVDFNSEVYKNISKQMRDFYFDGGHVNAETLDKMNQLLGDCQFNYGIILNARIQAAKSSGKTFFSMFSVSTDLSLSVIRAKANNLTNFNTHTDPIVYLFRNFLPDENYQNLGEDSLPRRLIKSTTEFLVNFAKFGNPMPDREPLYFKMPYSDHLHYNNITNDGIVPQQNPNGDRMEFWNKIFEDHKHLWNITFDFHLN